MLAQYKHLRSFLQNIYTLWVNLTNLMFLWKEDNQLYIPLDTILNQRERELLPLNSPWQLLALSDFPLCIYGGS